MNQIPPFLAMTKTCPPSVPPNTPFQCTFTVQNEDAANAVINLTFANTFPFPGGTPVAVLCLFNATPVTTLQPFGTPGDTCSGSFVEIASTCPGGPAVLTDQVTADGFDTGGFPMSGAAFATVQVTDCPPPTPTDTPTRTPAPAATSTPTNMPTGTPTNPNPPGAVVPTLDDRGMLILGLVVAGVGLLLIRRT